MMSFMDYASRISLVLAFVTCLLPMMTSVESSDIHRKSKAPQAKIKVDGVGHWFVDEYDRVRLFHGVNAVWKYYPWYPPFMLDDSVLDDLAKSGFNVVRLGSMWSGVEPADGVFNDTYIDILRDIVRRLADRGIYTILDMHQDVLSTLYYSYDGAPLWLIESFPEPTNPYPYPLQQVDAWALGYLTQACSEGFQFLYNNTNSAVEKWARFWVVVAERLGRDEPAVLGYEWMNEPWVGDYFQQPSLITPGVAGKQNLLPVYDYINEVVRRSDPVSIQFYEPITIGVAFDNRFDYLGSGFDRVPGGWYYNDVSAYAYHIYCWYMEVLPGDASDEERLEAAKNCTERLVPRVFEAQENDVKVTGGASILTEFGLCRTDGDRDQRTNIACEVFLDLADEYLQSWADWDYQGKWYLPGGEPNIGRQRAYSRPYARATAGTPTSMSFNYTTRVFQFTYRPNRSIPTDEAPTDIYVPTLFHYTSGYSVEVSPAEVTWDTDGDSLYVRHEGLDSDNFPDVITLVIRPEDE